MSGDRPALELDSVAAEIYSDVRLAPFLRRLLARSNDLLEAVAGSISLVDPTSQRYTKMAERGASCRLGQTFPLDEGVTGQVVNRRRPVVLSSYQQIPAGHLPAGHPAGSGAVVAVPIWWRGDVIGVNVGFAGRSRRFTAREVDGLEMLSQLAAPGIVQAGASDPSLANMIREYRRQENVAGGADGECGSRTIVTEVGRARPVAPSVAGVALDLVTLAGQAATRREPTARLHVAVVHGADRWRLLLYDAADSTRDSPSLEPSRQRAAGERGWQELVDSAGGGVSVEHVAGWGTLVRADLPYERAPQRPTAESARGESAQGESARGESARGESARGESARGESARGESARGESARGGSARGGSARGESARGGSAHHVDPAASPFTPREQQVAGLLADGLSDRSVAKALEISPKTVEKHVGALLRKTGTNSRTAAVMRALGRGWLPS